MIDRRAFCAGGALLLATACAASPTSQPEPRAEGGGEVDAAFEAIRAKLGAGARLGVAAIDTGSGRQLRFDADSRYAMCSVFKLPLAAAVLAEAARGRLSLRTPVHFTAADLLDYAPVVRAHAAEGSLRIGELCAAAVEVSDNSAANLLLPLVGGPAGLTRFLRAAGDAVTRLDRNEPALNTNLPGDSRDTTTPAAMAELVRSLLVGNVLPAEWRDMLANWTRRSTTGRHRLRAGLPAGWTVGDKTGTGPNGAHNDVAVAWRPNAAPLVIASFQSGGTADEAARNAAHAEVARLVVRHFAR